ncbi:MAG: ATP-binding protein [Bacteroidales bacterium]
MMNGHSKTGFFQLFDYISSPWFFFDSKLIILYVNHAFRQLVGAANSDGEVLSITSIFDFALTDDELKGLLLTECKGLQQGLEIDFTSPLAEFPEGKLLVSKFSDGGHCVFAGMVAYPAKQKNKPRPDVSDHHLFSMLLNELPDAIYFKDRDGKFFLTNRLHTKKLGFKDVNDFIGKTDYDLFGKEHAQQAFEDEQEVIRTGKTISKEEKENRLDGSITWASTSKMPLRDKAGLIVGTFGISKDITRIKEVEHELRKTQKQLQEANAAKDMFFSIIAHDLKNPFNSLIGLSEMMMEDYERLSDDEKKDMIANLHGISESTYNLLENLLDWSRVQTGSMTVNVEPICLCNLAEDVMDLLEAQARTKRINLTNNLKKNVWVSADKNMLRTIFRNLVSNAIKFTNPGGMVTIDGDADGSFCRFWVQDNGVGIESVYLEKLFQISETVKTYGTNDESGTGLGLILCREFAERNGGKITVESAPGKGSRFTVELQGEDVGKF